jgi:hypothetical protein
LEEGEFATLPRGSDAAQNHHGRRATVPRISRTQKLLRAGLEVLAEIALDPTKPDYIRRPAASTLVRHARAVEKAKQAEDKVKRDAAPFVMPDVLPPNGRGPTLEWEAKFGKRKPCAAPVQRSVWEMRPGESPTDFRLRCQQQHEDGAAQD